MDSRINIFTWFVCLGMLVLVTHPGLHAQIPVSVQFGEPTRECLGRGQICTIEMRIPETGNPPGNAVFGFLDFLPGGWEIQFLPTKSNPLSLDELLPAGYCDIQYALVIYQQEVDAKTNVSEVIIPPGRYKLVEEDGMYLLKF